VASREGVGSWLEGGPGAADPGSGGARLDLPESGPGSLAPVGRRAVALTIDWVLCLLIARAFLGSDPLAPLLVFAAENVLLVGTLGFTFGHRLLGIRVRPLARADVGPGPLRALARTVLLCLVIPAVVWDAEGRGLHDRAAGTLIVRR